MLKAASKLEAISGNPQFQNLDAENRVFIEVQANKYGLSHQDLINLMTIAVDLEMWDLGLVEKHWDETGIEKYQGKRAKQEVMNRLRSKWNGLRDALPDYSCGSSVPEKLDKINFKSKTSDDTILGSCPVFSEKTRCCNLLTLDAVLNCGYGCTYCSIQSFNHDDEIIFHDDFAEKLDKIELDPNKIYHIGTGQSSDSLLWGNRKGIMKELFAFANKHKNVILELKTKSANIGYLLENEIPKNVIVTWSVNAESITIKEEHGTASLEKRLDAAKQIAAKGNIIGFHLHPIVVFQGWEAEYGSLIDRLLGEFDRKQVALLSMGTLTFTKPVLKQLRERKVKSKILQMPFEGAAGKFSYPLELKQQFFKYVYDKFQPWHDDVFFYLCMEDASLWDVVFGYEYSTNIEFEDAMKTAYWNKVQTLSN